eukprot:TRINITY_DN64339_c0_g1_i1.p1 TRINITY_DN64339_c0_g1~~TRINITY_DN64339_c0_g1_i1.p1  ORF type:complete len:935 (-),score=172.18 TRINITY_DN64339_c0_g1_i1:31-2433(-)
MEQEDYAQAKKLKSEEEQLRAQLERLGWQDVDRSLPCTAHFEGSPQELKGRGTWDCLKFNRMLAANGVALQPAGNEVSFTCKGVYLVTVSYREDTQNTVASWTGVRLTAGSAVCGTSVGYGVLRNHDSHINTVFFLAEIDDTRTKHALQIGRSGDSIRINTAASPGSDGPIGGPNEAEKLPSVSASVVEVQKAHAQLEGPKQALACNGAWCNLSFTKARAAKCIELGENNGGIRFDCAGVYLIAISYRENSMGCTNSWTGARLVSADGAEVHGSSVGFGAFQECDTHVNAITFLAKVDDLTAKYNLQLGRAAGPIKICVDFQPGSGGPIGKDGEVQRLPCVAATVTLCQRAYAQLDGPHQELSGKGEWSSIMFSRARFACGISIGSGTITFAVPGLYQVALTYREGSPSVDSWTCARLAAADGATVCGTSVAFGVTPNSDPHLCTVTFIAEVKDVEKPYLLQLGRSKVPICISTDHQPGADGSIGEIGDAERLPCVSASLVLVGPPAETDPELQETQDTRPVALRPTQPDQPPSADEIPVGACCPRYWKNQDFGHRFTDRLEVGAQLEEQLQSMLEKTWKDKRTRDRKDGEMPLGVKLVKAERLEDCNLWLRYLRGKEELKQRRPNGVRPVNELDGQSESGFVRTVEAMAEQDVESLEASLNECYLWHGTTVEGALGITSGGFKLSFSGSHAGSMFGKGAYFAECSSKADEYTRDSDNPIYKGIYAMLLCRVLCGEMFYITKSDHRAIAAALDSGAHDAVLGDREASVGTYREFVVFDDRLIYPEYIVLYKRVSASSSEN